MNDMESEYEHGISLPQSGFYSVQDESNRRYSRTGKHRILAQKYDAILMKYRYSDETEKSSPYSKTLSDSDSPVTSDSPSSYQGIYSPQLAQISGNFDFENTPKYSLQGPRRSWIDDESATKWISPGVHPVMSNPLEKNQHPDYENVELSDQWQSQDGSPQDIPGIILESKQRPYEQKNHDIAANQSHRGPPPPYSVAVRSSKGRAPKSHLDIAPHLTKDLQGLHDIDKLLEDLEGSEPDSVLSYQQSDLATLADEPKVDLTKQSDVSVWAELVHIDNSEENSEGNSEENSNDNSGDNSEDTFKDDKPRRPSNGIIITGHRERRTGSPDRHIRFVLEAERAKTHPEDIAQASQDTYGNGPASRSVNENQPYDAEVSGERAYQHYERETVGLTPLVDEVFSYHSTSDYSAPAAEKSLHNSYGVDNPGYAYDIEDHDHTSVDHQRPTQRPMQSDIVRRRCIDWYGTGQVYDSSQSSTLDSVFTERSWSSDVGRPRAFRQKRRVFPKPRDPVGDLGDGLQTKPGRITVPEEHDPLHHGSTAISRQPGHKDERVQIRGHGSSSRDDRGKKTTRQQDIRKALIKQELELFMHRNSGSNNLPPTSRRLGSHESRRSSVASSHLSRNVNKAISTRPDRSQHRTHRAGKYPLNNQGHMQVNQSRMNSGQKPRNFSDDVLHRAVPLRNPGLGGKKDRPLTYPNDVNRPFSQSISQDDNNAKVNDVIAINGNKHPPQKLLQNQQPKHPPPSRHPIRRNREDNRKTNERRHYPSHGTRRPSDNHRILPQSHPAEKQCHVRSKDSFPSGHIHPTKRPPIEVHPKHDRHSQNPSNERRARDENGRASPTITAVTEVSPSALGPKTTPNNIEQVQHKPLYERSTSDGDERAAPTNAVVLEVPRRLHDPETTPNNNQQEQQGEQTPAGENRNFTNWRFFSVMAAIWFFPIGIWALRKSHQVDARVKAKDLPGARRASRSARNHAIAAFVVLGFIVLILLARLIEITIDPNKTFIQYYKIVPDEVEVI